MEISPFLFSRCLSMNDVELTSSLLKGLKTGMSTDKGRAMRRAVELGRLLAQIFGVISPQIRINEVTITTSRKKAAAGWFSMSNISLMM